MSRGHIRRQGKGSWETPRAMRGARSATGSSPESRFNMFVLRSIMKYGFTA